MSTVLLLAACGTRVTARQVGSGAGLGGGSLSADGGLSATAPGGQAAGAGTAGSPPVVPGASSSNISTGTGGASASGPPQASTAPAAQIPGGTTVSPAGVRPGGGQIVPASRPVEVGIPVPANIGAVTAVLGSGGGGGSPSVPSQQQIQNGYQVIVDYINGHGGLKGHKVVPVYASYDATQNAATNDQTLCTSFTQDHKVFAALGWLNHTQNLTSCLQAANAILVDQGGYVAYDDTAFAQNPLYMTAGALSLTRVAHVEVNGLVRQGFFSPGSRIGLLADNSPPFMRAIQALKATLGAHGLKLTDEQEVQPTQGLSDVAPVQQAISNATLRFRAEGIDRVIFLDNNGDTQQPFNNAEKAQSYYPRLGYTSNETPSNHGNGQYNSSANQEYIGSSGIGWDPTIDIQSAPPNATGQLCNKLESSVGNNPTQAQQLYWPACDQLLTLVAAANASSGGLTTTGVIQGLARMSNFTPAEALGPLNYSGGRRDGAAVGRFLTYQAGCQCMVYSSGTVSLDSLESP
ncbi:MAG TPA: hypothetical protein VFP54_06665 [Acidimicrobiales bacterium]|nr:hypothetical protein [Acidimicrobiales bacterium]